jgi:hypothetical protein
MLDPLTTGEYLSSQEVSSERVGRGVEILTECGHAISPSDQASAWICKLDFRIARHSISVLRNQAVWKEEPLSDGDFIRVIGHFMEGPPGTQCTVSKVRRSNWIL